jgi:hypothetical protein
MPGGNGAMTGMPAIEGARPGQHDAQLLQLIRDGQASGHHLIPVIRVSADLSAGIVLLRQRPDRRCRSPYSHLTRINTVHSPRVPFADARRAFDLALTPGAPGSVSRHYLAWVIPH